jgi:uncharacterized membrane protein
MSGLQKSQQDNTVEAESKVIQSTPDDSSSTEQTQNNIFNQQNNFHLTQQYDIDKISGLSTTNPKMANRLMCLYEKQQNHNITMDQRVVTIEEKEQKSRDIGRPYQIKFAFLALTFAWTLSLVALGCAIYFVNKGQPWLAGISISIPIGVAVANMLGFKAAGQTSKDKSSDHKEENSKAE